MSGVRCPVSGGIRLPEVKMPAPPQSFDQRILKVFSDVGPEIAEYEVVGRRFKTYEAAQAFVVGIHFTEGHSPTRGRSLDEEQMELDAAKIERYMRFVQPTLQTIMPSMDRVERASQDVSVRLEALERSFRRTLGLLILANAAALAFIYLAKYLPAVMRG